ncbi:MAG: histidine phosphatase family protein [Micromonosporaceae bacterium]
MAVIHLVRHGQASFGAREYDKLSPLGTRQSTHLGATLRERGLRPDRVASGTMTRHQETAAACLTVLGDGLVPQTDERWNEFDHTDVIERHKPAYRSRVVMGLDLARTGSPGTAFQAMFDQALTRWTTADTGYHETWSAFSTRVSGALEDLAASLERSQTALVFTSGGVISAVAAKLLGGVADRTSTGSDPALWLNLNRVTVNTGVTTLIVGRRGTSLVTFNEHSHLDRTLLSYR